MKFLTTSLGYFKWHYGKALITTFTFWKNILIFLFDFFSIKSLLGNFFTPWKRLADNYPKNFSFKAYFSIFIINTLMRLVGIFLRSIVIIIGIVCCILYILFLPITLVLWLLSPVIITALIVYGFILIIFS